MYSTTAVVVVIGCGGWNENEILQSTVMQKILWINSLVKPPALINSPDTVVIVKKVLREVMVYLALWLLLTSL